MQDFKENFFKNLKEFVIKTSEFASPVSAEKLKSLVQEVEKNFEFAQHKIEFEADLPYNSEKQELFLEILPIEKFQALQDRVIQIPEKKIIYDSFYCSLSYINENLHQANPDLLNILHKLNLQIQEFREFLCFIQFYPTPYKLAKFVRLQKLETLDTFREFKNICFDTQYSIQDILNKANEARQKKNEEKSKARVYANQVIILEDKLSSVLLQKLKKFMSLCNNLLEREMRDCLIKSFKNLYLQLKLIQESLDEIGSFMNIINHFQWHKRNKKIICFNCSLGFNKDGKICIQPGIEEIIDGFNDFLWDSVHEAKKISSLELGEIGNVRDDGFMRIIYENDEEIQKEIQNCCDLLTDM